MKRFLFLIMILFLLSGCIFKKEKMPNIYDVNFIVDGVVVQTLQIKEGEDAVAPDDPTKEGFEFVGWDKAFTNIQANTDINAIFEIAKVSYKVRFYNEGILINSQDVIEGEKAIAPIDPI
ncbi:MAG: InlB B-repeat-containing protein [Bacilli bacterium]